MTVSQYIKVRNPPSRPFVAYATMPLPTGTDPATVGNSLNALQQVRRFQKLKRWDIYEWMVFAPAGTTDILVSDDFEPQEERRPVRKGGGFRGGDIGGARGGFTTTPRRPVEGLWVTQAPALLAPGAVRLIFTGPDPTETVQIGSPSGLEVRSGPLRSTMYNHKTTSKYGSFHYWWDIRRGDPLIRLTINLHTGIPAPEVLLTAIEIALPAELAWVPEMSDPAVDVATNKLLKPLGDPNRYYLFPRMGQRSWRLILYPIGLTEPAVADRQDAGWGVADWSQGGWYPADLPVAADLFAHVTNMASQVRNEALADDGRLLTMENSMDATHAGPLPTTVLWPAVGQPYGGPTGSDGKYKPYHGIRPLAANERVALLKLKVEQLRHHSRDWTVIYEPDGRPVVPEDHLDSSGNRAWQCFIGGSGFFSADSGGWHPYDRTWRDSGFGFDAAAFRVWRLPTQRDEIQSFPNAAGVQVTRWDNWDGQHRMLGWAHDLALAWLEADDLSILYMVGEAERGRMTHWAGGNPNYSLPSSQGIGMVSGREESWLFYAIAAALPLLIDDNQELDDDGNDLTPNTRRGRWINMELARFVQGTEKAIMPNGIAWHAGFSGKGFTDPPFGDGNLTGNYVLVQLFEVGYGINALHALYGAMGNHWRSVLGPHQIDVRALSLGFAQAIETLAHMGNQPLSSAAIVAGGSGFLVNDVVTLVDDRMRGGQSHSPFLAPVNARIRIDTIGGGGAATALTIIDAGRYQQHPTDHVWDGVDGALTCCIVSAAAVAAGGSGYQNLNNQVVTVSGGTPLNVNESAQFRLTVVAGAVTGAALVRQGRYYVPPATPWTIPGGNNNATLNLTRSCSGNGLRLDLTFGAITFPAPGAAEAQIWKHFPVGPHPSSTRYVTSSDFSPLDICALSAHDNPFTTGISGIGQQDKSLASLSNCIGLWGFATVGEDSVPSAYSFLVAKRVTFRQDITQMLAFWRAEGLSTAGFGELLENWWPALAWTHQMAGIT